MKPNAKIILTAMAALIGILLLAQPKNDVYMAEAWEEQNPQDYTNSPAEYTATQVNQQPMKTVKTSRPTEGNEPIEMKKIVSPQTGKVLGYMPLPANWEISNGAIKGPGGLIARETPMRMYDSSQRQPMSAQQILRYELAQSIQNEGGKITNTFPIPGIMQYDANYSNQLYGSQNMQKSFDALGVDIVDANGNPSFLIVRQMAFSYGYGGNWGYLTHTLHCQPSAYKASRDAYIYGIANAQSNPQQIAEYNRNEAMKEQQSWASHNTRMRNNQAAFDAQQRSFTASSNAALDASMQTWRTNNEISDMSMDTWRNANASSDRMQDMTVNGIHEWENVYDPASDQSYKVESGYDRYFMNGQGEYFGTNDQFYQPAQDINLNGTWTEVKRRGN